MVLTRRRRSVSVTAPDPALDAAAAATAAVAAAEAAARATDRLPPEDDPVPADRPAPRRGSNAGDRFDRPRASRIFPIRIALVAVMGTTLAALGWRAFDERVPEMLIGPVLVSVIALVVRRRKLTIRVAAEFVGVAIATLVAGFAVGSTIDTVLSDLADGPRRLFTTEWPSPLDAGVVMAIAAFVTTATAVAADIAGRQRFHVAPLAVLAVGFIGVMGFAAPVSPPPWALWVLAGSAVLLLLARPGDDPRVRLRVLAGERSLLATFAGLGLAVVATSGAIAWADRSDPRNDVQADLTLALLDPIEQTAALRAVDPPIEMFRVTDRSALIGPTLPTRWRTSALTTYDGQRWLPAITLRPIGRRLGQPTDPALGVAPPIEFDLDILTDDISLVPLPGRPLELDGDGVAITTDADRTAIRLVDAPRPGTTLRVVSEVAPIAVEAGASPIGTRQVDEIAGAFADAAVELGGDPSAPVLDRLLQIEATMRDEWQLDPAAPGAGQQLALIERFVTETNRGTREQFVTAFVLLARSIGVDARVATGFLVPPDQLTTPLVLRSRDATVWAEVQLVGRGFLAFDPVPPLETEEEENEPTPPSQQSPAAPQPPREPPPDPTDDTEELEDDTDLTATTAGWRTWAARGAIVGGGVLVPVMALVGTITALKWLRRRRRLRVADPRQRIVGVWANTTDSLVDAGLDILPAWTDERIAEHAGRVAPGVPYETRRLAVAATSMTFGSGTATDQEVAEAIASAQSIDGAIRSTRSRWQRWRWRLSTRSLRKRHRSPVVA